MLIFYWKLSTYFLIAKLIHLYINLYAIKVGRNGRYYWQMNVTKT